MLFRLTTLALILITNEVFGADFDINPTRRKEQFSFEPGHFIYPIVMDVPGMGRSYGVGGTGVNLFRTDIDVTAFHLQGDFDTTGVAILNFHLLPRFLILDGGYYKFRSATQVFDRGINSNKDVYIAPETEGDAKVFQATLTFFQRKFETYIRNSSSNYKLNQVTDNKGGKFENIDRGEKNFSRMAYGLKLDLTDDKIDPRNGVRFESELTGTSNTEEDSSRYNTLSNNLIFFLPVANASSWAFNLFNSRSFLKTHASTDENYLRQKIGLSCNQIQDPATKAKCTEAENKIISERVAVNRYGQATSLGGTQRLRSFPNGRFIAGNALFAGSEFRLNLTDEKTYMNYFFLKGVRTNIQLAFFAETGTVVEKKNEYFNSKWMHSYGAGFRLCFSGVILRFDGALGNEGGQFQMFLDYPWNLYAIDSGI